MAPTEDVALPKTGGSKFDESKVKRDGDGQFARSASRNQPKKDAGPTTVAGYEKMFDKVPVAQWGGGDVSISHKLPDGRRVWLYGDTLSKNNGFVHSTALVQTGNKLHVSRGGKQLLPNSGTDPADPKRELISWIDGVKQGPTRNTLIVSSMQMSVGKADAWDFRNTREGQSRQAIVKVDDTGNMKFVKWKGWAPTPTKNNPHLTNDFVTEGPNHYTYGTITHDIKLADGSKLTTRSQNWDNSFADHMNSDGSFRYRDWAPIFGKSTDLARKELRMATPLDDFLEHQGVKGMKWGVRKADSASASTRRPLSQDTKDKMAYVGKELGFGSIAPAAMLMGAGPPISIALGISIGVLRTPPVQNAIKQTSKASADLMKEIGSTKLSAMREARESREKIKNSTSKLGEKAEDLITDLAMLDAASDLA